MGEEVGGGPPNRGASSKVASVGVGRRVGKAPCKVTSDEEAPDEEEPGEVTSDEEEPGEVTSDEEAPDEGVYVIQFCCKVSISDNTKDSSGPVSGPVGVSADVGVVPVV